MKLIIMNRDVLEKSAERENAEARLISRCVCGFVVALMIVIEDGGVVWVLDQCYN